jgi:hypothetical protein
MNVVTEIAEKLTTYDQAEDLISDAVIAAFMVEAFASEDAGYIVHALGVVARAKGVSRFAVATPARCLFVHVPGIRMGVPLSEPGYLRIC